MKDKNFIYTENPAISRAVQLSLFKHGYKWYSDSTEPLLVDSEWFMVMGNTLYSDHPHVEEIATALKSGSNVFFHRAEDVLQNPSILQYTSNFKPINRCYNKEDK